MEKITYTIKDADAVLRFAEMLAARALTVSGEAMRVQVWMDSIRVAVRNLTILATPEVINVEDDVKIEVGKCAQH